MKTKTTGLLGALVVFALGALLQVSCSSNNLNHTGTGGIDGGPGVGGSTGFSGQGAGGQLGAGGLLGTGGQGGAGGCSDWLAGQGGTECGSPVVTAVDADAGAVICDPSFTVIAVGAAVICHPTGNPFELYSFDGAATCTFSLQSLNGIEVPVSVEVDAAGYAPGLVSIVPCPSGRDVKYVVPLAPLGDAGTVIQDASGDRTTNCTVDDSTDDCTTRGLHRYVCPASEPIEPAGFSPTGEAARVAFDCLGLGGSDRAARRQVTISAASSMTAQGGVSVIFLSCQQSAACGQVRG